MQQSGLESRVIEFCQRLVRVNSLSGSEKAVADLVAAEMQALKYDQIERDLLGSVIGVVRGKGNGPTVLLDAHMDVVPVNDAEKWRHGPFSGDVADGKLWGRGSTDVKGSLAALTVAVGLLDRAKLGGTIMVSAGVGEEAIEGVALAAVLERFAVDRVVICEPTGLHLGLGHKGRAGLLFEAQGVAAHTSQPDRGKNAVYRMLEAVQRIRALPPHQDEILGRGLTELVEIRSYPSPGGSMVPYHCFARFDRRLVRGETPASVREEMLGAIRGLDGLSLSYHQSVLDCFTGEKFEVDNFHPAWAQAQDSDMAQRAQTALRDAGQEAAFWLAPYSTNAAASAALNGLPTVVYGAGEIDQAHAIDETVTLEQLRLAAEGYQALAMGLSRA
jgi:putative selenium metabolism hydrolase